MDIGIIVVLGIAAVAACGLRPTSEASAPIEAVPVEVKPTEPTKMVAEVDPEQPLTGNDSGAVEVEESDAETVQSY